MDPVADRPGIDLTAEDLEQIDRRGIAPEEIRRQWTLLRAPPPPAPLDRPCTVGDGILALTPEAQDERIALFEPTAAAGRWSKLVPASGAASRMFRFLLHHLEEGQEPDPAVLAFCSRLQDFAFWPTLANGAQQRLESWQRRRAFRELLRYLLLQEEGAAGLGLGERPKGLLPFHHDPAGGEPHTPVAEHLLEAAHLVRDQSGLCSVLFTVSPESLPAFEAHVEAVQAPLEATRGVRFRIRLSPQSPTTDTVALGSDGNLVRDEGGELLFRPGGHGALISNLEAMAREGADLVLIKNIDNVQPEGSTALTLRWKKILGGTLVEVQARAFALLERLHAGGEGEAVVEEALLFLQETFGLDPARLDGLPTDPVSRRAFAIEQLHRPLRVCGVVPNRGEPGGGPFWVHTASGITPQIIEGAQIDTADARQRAILATATHFNPVDLACGVRDFRGEPFDLARFVDPRGAFVAEKSYRGKQLRALERPGLWNGAMAHWNTVFLEVPAATFTPVKTALDLLRPEHQPRP
jgi:hypothetical protein